MAFYPEFPLAAQEAAIDIYRRVRNTPEIQEMRKFSPERAKAIAEIVDAEVAAYGADPDQVSVILIEMLAGEDSARLAWSSVQHRREQDAVRAATAI